jgi:TPR repeat protein
VTPEDVYEFSKGCEWFTKVAADAGSQEAQYSLGGSYLEHAAASGHIPSQWSVFQRDPSRLDYLDNCARSHHRPAMLRKAELGSPAVAIPLLVELQISGSDEASDKLYELRDHLSPEAALGQARFWVSRDPNKSLNCYRLAGRDDFALYRSILIAYNRQFDQIPEDLSEDGLRRTLEAGNKLAALPLADLAADDERREILERGLPTRPAYFALAWLCLGYPEPDNDVIYEYFRDGILADSTESADVQSFLMSFFNGEITPLKRLPQIRLEIARFLTDPAENSFEKDVEAVVAALPEDDDLPEYTAVWATVAFGQMEVSTVVQICERALKKSTLREIEFVLFKARKSTEYLRAAAAHGHPEAQSQYAIQALGRWSSLTARQKALVIECLRARSSDPSQIECRYLYGLFVASGESGVRRDPEAAKRLWKDITIDDVSRITVEVDCLQPGVSLFTHNLLATADNDEDLVTKLYSIASLLIRDDPQFAAILLKQVFLNPRVNALEKFTDQDVIRWFLDRVQEEDDGQWIVDLIREKYADIHEAEAEDSEASQRVRMQ